MKIFFKIILFSTASHLLVMALVFKWCGYREVFSESITKFFSILEKE